MLRSTLLALLTFSSFLLFGQWTQRADITGPARTNAVGFSLGTKGYIATGYDANANAWLNDCWEFDPVLNSWVQKASMPDNGREGAVAFTIGNKAYVATGKRDTVFKNDMFEFDPILNTWIPRANFPGSARSEASAFSIGTKGYVGIGYDGINKFDFYEWDQPTNTWLARANFNSNPRNSAFGFSLSNGRGYFGGGYASGNVYQDIVEYNPSNNQWLFTGMTNYQAYAMAASTIGAYAFYGTGIDDNSVTYNNFTQWDPSGGPAGLTPFSGSMRYNAVSFSVGNSVFIGTGFDSWVTQDLWEYTTTLSSNTYSWGFIKVYCYNDFLRIDKYNLSDNGFELQILDLNGKVQLTKDCRGDHTAVSVAHLPSGIYFARLSQGKFIKLERIFIP